MASYGYAPPPPPPPTSSTPQQHQQTNYGAHRQNSNYGRGGRGSGPSGRGRGGGHGSGHQAYHHQPAQPPAPYDYAASAAAAAAAQPYPHQAAPSYGGAQHPQPGSYVHPQQQWSPDQHGAQAAAYHPGYGHQPYAHPQAQQPAYQAPQQYAYQAPPPAPPAQWNSQAHSQPGSSFGGGGGRTRGGHADRGGRGRGAAPIVQTYDHAQYAQVNGAYGQPYHDPHAASYPPAPYHYGAPPPPPQGRQDGYQGHNHRGRGGHRGKGRGNHNSGDRAGHHNKNRNDHHGKQSSQHQQHQQHQQKQKQKQKQDDQPTGKKKKRKTNTLGLTPGMDSETEDDEGEEKTLANLLGPETFVPDDIAAYIAQRKKNFPTKARIEAKKAESGNKTEGKKEDKTSELEKQADKLRRQLRKVESSIKRKREQGDEGDEMRDSKADEDESSDDGAPEVMSSRSPAVSRAETHKQGPSATSTESSAAAAAAAAAKKADVSRHCKYYSTGGSCGKKSKCRFVHDPAVREAAIKDREANNGRMTIQQRLILNDKEQEDLAILESIQYLREKGIMNESKKLAAEESEKPSPTTATITSSSPGTMKGSPPPPKAAKKHSTLPAASPSLPPLPVKREPASLPRRSNPPPSTVPSAENAGGQDTEHYQGWLLKPYGSSSGTTSKSDDLP